MMGEYNAQGTQKQASYLDTSFTKTKGEKFTLYPKQYTVWVDASYQWLKRNEQVVNIPM